LKQVCFAAHDYLGTEGAFPTGTYPSATLPPENRLSWLVILLPYLERDDLWSWTDWDQPWNGDSNRHLVNAEIKLLLCPAGESNNASPAIGLTQYVGMAGIGADAPMLSTKDKRAGLFGYDSSVHLDDVKDGTSNTIMIMETATDLGPWAAGGPATVRGLDPDGQPYLATDGQFGLKHRKDTIFRTNPVGANAALVDGSVRWLPSSISARTLEALVTIAGGDEVENDF
jgi:hypothetical protein